jgi:hypothetical protein
MFTFSLDILNFVISGLTLVFSLFGCRYHIWRFEAWMFTSTVSSIGVQLKSYLRGCCEGVLPEVTWPEVTLVTWRKWHKSRALSWSMFCACTTGSCAISALVRSFWPKWQSQWQSHVTGRGSVRKGPCPEVVLTGSRFCACPAFPRVFFLEIVTWLPDVIQGHLTPFEALLGVRMRNRKMCNICNDRRPRDPFGSVL